MNSAENAGTKAFLRDFTRLLHCSASIECLDRSACNRCEHETVSVRLSRILLGMTLDRDALA
jgi:hypothetical protein